MGKRLKLFPVPWFLEPLRTYFPEPEKPKEVVERNCVDCKASIIGTRRNRIRCNPCKAYRHSPNNVFVAREGLSPEDEAMWSDESFWA
jgi:hypothetical protein